VAYGQESGSTTAVRRAIGATDGFSCISRGSRVVIKPNFTYPFYRPGVTTSPEVLEAVVALCAERTSDITVVESDGGSHAWRAEEAFEGHRVPEICRKYGAKAVNLSSAPARPFSTKFAGVKVQFQMPALLLDGLDVFITLPVPKVHVMTALSVAFKNQWGCIPDVKRLRYHPIFPHAILAINRIFPRTIAIADGTYFLNRTGPMGGDPVRMNLILASTDFGALSSVAAHIMGIDPRRAPHKRLAMEMGMMPRSVEEVEIVGDCTDLSLFRQQFTLQRTWINWVTLAAFKSRLATKIVYDSVFAHPIHEALYALRGKPSDIAPKW